MNKIHKTGLILSLLCTIHCVLLPFILTIFPYFFISLFLSEKIEIYILLTSLIFSSMSVCFGLKTHKNFKILPIFATGLIIILIAKTIFHSHESNSHNILMIIGGLIISVSHFLNNKLCIKCKRCSLQ